MGPQNLQDLSKLVNLGHHVPESIEEVLSVDDIVDVLSEQVEAKVFPVEILALKNEVRPTFESGDWVKEHMEQARKIFLKDKELGPIAFAYAPEHPKDKDSGGALIMFPIKTKDNKEKDASMEALRSILKETKASQVLMIMETWLLKTDKDKAEEQRDINRYRSLSEHPDRQEAIVAIYQKKDSDMMMQASAIIKRDGEDVSLEEWEIHEFERKGMEGRFSSLF